MDILFIDSSALAKRYLIETGTDWLIDQLEPEKENTIYIAGVTRVEVISAFKKKERRGDITIAQSAMGILQFRFHLDTEYLIIESAPQTLEEAMAKVESYVLRAYDAVQLTTALTINREFLALGGTAYSLPDRR